MPEPALNQKRQEIVHLLQKWGKPMSPQEIAAALGRDYTLIKQMLARIVRTDEVQKSDYGKYIVVLNSCSTPATLATLNLSTDVRGSSDPLFTTNVLGFPNKKEYILMY